MNAPTSVAPYIQHTLIETGVTSARIVKHCEECVEYGFDAAMVPALWVRLARDVLAGTGIKVATAVDFPIGQMTTAGKVAETRAVIAAGADQLDVGVPIGQLRSGADTLFHDDIVAVVAAAGGAPVKVMLELALLSSAERDRAVDLAVAAGAAYVKNASSGAVAVATVDDIAYLRHRVPPEVRVKASGGITSEGQAWALIEAGADLIGTSAGVAIVHGQSAKAY